MPAKLILRWNVRPDMESEYFEFLVHELIPTMNKLGINDIQVWFTAYGQCEQKMAEGINESVEDLLRIMRTTEWANLTSRLQGFVLDFSQKVIPATRGFQI